MAIDRVALLRNADTLVQQGKLDQAIAEYRRIINDQPRDWNTANVLGDLYLRAGQTDKAVDLFIRVGDGLRQDGIVSKAGAVYKKILKVRPHDEHVLLQAADIAAGQGLLAEARTHLKTVNEQRRSRGDASELVDPESFISKVSAARRLAVDTPDPVDLLASKLRVVQPVAPTEPIAPAPVTAPPSISAPSITQASTVPDETATMTDGGSRSSAEAATPVLQQPPRDLEDVFADLRKDASRRFVTNNPDEELTAGLALYDAGQVDFAVPRLEAASRSQATRFRAAAALGRICLERGETWQAIDWFERAAEVTPPTREDGHRLLFELADALETVGESARALAICLELRADAGDYQDLETRVERLAKAQARG